MPTAEEEYPWSWGNACALTRQLNTHVYLSQAIAKFYVLLDEDQRALAQQTNWELFRSAVKIFSDRVMHFSPYQTKPAKATTELPLSASARRHLVTVVGRIFLPFLHVNVITRDWGANCLFFLSFRCGLAERPGESECRHEFVGLGTLCCSGVHWEISAVPLKFDQAAKLTETNRWQEFMAMRASGLFATHHQRRDTQINWSC